MPLSNWSDRWPEQYAELEADRDRLREALEAVARHADGDLFEPKRAYYAEVKKIARDALASAAPAAGGES